jgi:UDP-MurNAc hydroxylase
VFNGGGKTIVNNNDCPYALARSVCDYVVTEHGNVDFLLTGYSGAGPYPQCYDMYSEADKLRRAAAKKDQFLHMAMQYINHLRPHYFLPFAGQYTLGGRLAALNRFRGVPELEELPELFQSHLSAAGSSSQMVLLNSMESFDIDESVASAPFIPPDPVARQRFVEDELTDVAYTYDVGNGNANGHRDLSPELSEAYARMLRYQNAWGGYRSDWSIYFDTEGGGLYRVPFDASQATRVDGETLVEPYVRVVLPHALFEMILNRKAHFNNAEIGSHLRFFRSPDSYEPMIFSLACYLQR